MKKRIIAALLSATMIITLAACGKKAEPEQTAEQEPVEETTETAEEEPAAEEEVQEPGVLIPIVCTKSYYSYDDEIEKQLFTGKEEGVILDDSCQEAYPALYKTLSENWEKTLSEGDKNAESMTKEARDFYDEMVSYGNDMEYFTSYSDENDIYVLRADDVAFSYTITNSTYTGGAHGMYGNGGYTYDSQTGQEIKLSDVIKDLDTYGQKLFDKVSEEYPDVVNYLDDPTTLRDQIVEEVKGEYTNWALTPNGIRYYFNPYDIAAYAAGQQIIEIGYKEEPSLFNEKYVMPEGTGYVVKDDYSFKIDADGDGDLDSITIEGNYPPYEEGVDSYEAEGVNVVIDNKTTTTIGSDSYCYNWSGYQMHTAGGKDFLVVELGMENDYQQMIVCEAGNGNVRELGSYGLYEQTISYDDSVTGVSKYYAITDPANMKLAEHYDRLGTYTAGCTFHLTDDGKLETDDEYAYLTGPARQYQVIKSKVDLTVDVVDEAGEVTEADVKLPSGTEYNLYRTKREAVSDGLYYVDCTLTDGRIVRLEFSDSTEANEWQHKVNGCNEYDAFENVLYAG